MEKVIGIELGTANASVAVLKDGGQPFLVPDEQGRAFLPSVVAYSTGEPPIAGLEARRRRLIDPARTILGVKKLLGREFKDPHIQALLPLLPYPVVSGPSGKAAIQVGDQVYSPSEVAAVILSTLKARVEAHVGETVRKTVLVVPASYSDPQRLAMRLAAQAAGLEVLRIINQPTAGAVLYSAGKDLHQRVGIYSFGGGTLDVSVVDIQGPLVHVLSSSGDCMLGGDELDRQVFEILRRRFKKAHGIDLAEDLVACQRLLGAAESAKIHLTENPTVEVRLREMAYGNGGPIDLVDEVQRTDVIAACQDVVRRTLVHAEHALQSAHLTPDLLDAMLLMGGSSMTPLVVESMARFAGRTPSTALQQEGCAAMGAAIYGGVLLRQGGVRAQMQTVVVDVQSQSLFHDVGGARERLISRNAPLPAQARRIFTTHADDQESLTVGLFQGESGARDGGVRVGELVVDGIRPLPRGEVQVEVLFEMDPDGVLTVSATDVATGNRTPAPVRVGVEALEQDVVMLRVQRGELRA